MSISIYLSIYLSIYIYIYIILSHVYYHLLALKFNQIREIVFSFSQFLIGYLISGGLIVE